MVGPAAAAQQLTSGVGKGVLLSVVLALAEAWLGITLAFYTDWPSSFWISALSAAVYLLTAFPLTTLVKRASSRHRDALAEPAATAPREG
jgi:ABC-type Mn2+/Zn2+ transport system permease subunit